MKKREEREVSLQAMLFLREIHSSIHPEVSKHSENHLAGFLLEKGKEGQAKEEISFSSLLLFSGKYNFLQRIEITHQNQPLLFQKQKPMANDSKPFHF